MGYFVTTVSSRNTLWFTTSLAFIKDVLSSTTASLLHERSDHEQPKILHRSTLSTLEPQGSRITSSSPRAYQGNLQNKAITE